MTPDFFADPGKTIKRAPSEAERAATGGLVLADLLPDDRRKRKRFLRRKREEARLVELG